MSKASTFFKTTAILSTALLSLLGACAIDDPIDYTTDGYTAGRQGGGSGDGGNTGSSYDFVEWTRQLGTSSLDEATGIATDSSGNVYVTGRTLGALEGTSSGGQDLFVVKYDSVGVKQWTKQLGSGEIEHATGIATDSSGNVYVTGNTNGALEGTSSGGGDFFVVKYDSGGIKQWTKQLGTSDADFASGIATDSSDNVYVTGFSGGNLDNNTGAYYEDLFVVKYDSDGVRQWTQPFGTYEINQARGIATDSSGNVYVTGYTTGDLDNNTNAGERDLFVIKYDSGGAKKWFKQLGTSSDDRAHGIATDSTGNVYVTGYTHGGLDGTNAGDYDLFVVKYDSAGVKLWTKQLGTSTYDYAEGIATDSTGNVYVTGYTEGSLDGNTNAGSADIFVVKYDSAGVRKWTKQLGTSSLDEATGIATDSSGNVYVTGSTDGALDGNTRAGYEDLFVVKFK